MVERAVAASAGQCLNWTFGEVPYWGVAELREAVNASHAAVLRGVDDNILSVLPAAAN